MAKTLCTTPLLLAVVAALAAGAAAPAPAAAASSCAAPHSRTVAASTSARVYTVKVRDAVPGPGTYPATRFYGCRYRTGRRTRIADQGEPCVLDENVGTVRLAGVYTALSFRSVDGCAGESTYAYAKVIDLRNGGVRFNDIVSPRDDADYRVTDLELRSTGTMGYILERRSFPAPGTAQVSHQVFRQDGTMQQLLDSGPAIDPTSLALSGATLYWTNAGAPRSAGL